MRGQDQVYLPNIEAIVKELKRQKASQAQPSFAPQAQFILCNRYYAEAALIAIRAGKVIAYYLSDTRLGGYSLELQMSSETAGVVLDAYNAECDRRDLY